MVTRQDAREVFKDFQTHSQTTGGIQIFPVGKPKSFTLPNGITNEANTNFKVKFTGEDRGVSWVIKFSHFAPTLNCSIEAKINPKILTGTKDYVATSSEIDYKELQRTYDKLARSISKSLPRFSSNALKRVDYCINLDIQMLNLDCTPNQLIKLIKRGNIPAHYKELQLYDPVAHRSKDEADSFYLESKSLNINFYWKYPQLKEKHKKYKKNINIAYLEALKNIIRLEIQCKYLKTYRLRSETLRDMGYTNLHSHLATTRLLSDEMSRIVMSKYFSRVIMQGDYYTLQGAINRVNACCSHPTKIGRLTAVLSLISKCRGISKAKKHLEENQGNVIEFNRSLRELVAIGVNPVTIPREWGVEFIPCILGLIGE
jgi:hypothetical protein